MEQNEITLKIKYSTDSLNRIKEYICNYNSVLKFTYNRQKENNKLTTKEITELQKTMNNVFIGSHLKNSVIFDSKALVKRNKEKKIVFGGKKLFFDRMKGKVSKEEYKTKKLVPLFSVGQANRKGNRLFQILDENTVLFKPSKKEHFLLNIKVNKKYSKYLKSLILKQEEKTIPITYRLGLEYVYISFDLNQIEKIENTTNKLSDRIFAIDLNPNYVGWGVVDWKNEKDYNLIKSGVISLKELNDYENSLNVSNDDSKKKYIANKRNYEVIQIGYKLVGLANHYKCQIFSMEDLTINSSDKSKGRKYNRLCNNQWCRNRLTNTITKLCGLYKITLQKVVANYSSFIGNLVYRNEKLPDMVLSSIEIGRRSYEFFHQYIAKDKPKQKNIIFDKLENVKDRITQSLEELSCSVEFDNLSDLYYKLKKAKLRYRFSFDESREFFRKYYKKSFITLYNFA